MGIEGGSSNNEIQNQEINQSTNEQIEQNQAEHQRSGEELEGNSTIDNEGERKQIEGKDDATESSERDSLQLDSDDSKENENDQEQPAENEVTSPEQQKLDNQDSIEGDTTSADGMSENDQEIIDSLDLEDYIEDEDLSETDDTEENEGTAKSLDQDDSIENDDSNDGDDTDLINEDFEASEQDSLDNEDSIEDDSENEEEFDSIENNNETKESENPEGEKESDEDNEAQEESENPEDESKVDGLDGGDGPDGLETKEIDKPLTERLKEVYDKYYDAADDYGVDDYGNSCAILSPEQKKNMVNELKQEYDNTPKEDRGNTFVPESSDYLKDGAISRAETADGNHSSWINYEWPDNDGFKTENDIDGNPVVDKQETTIHKGDVVDRVGHNGGRFTSPVENGEPGSVESRALPYHFTEGNIENEPSYHQFRAKGDITPENIQDKISNISDPVKQKSLQREFDKGDGKTYEGEIGHAFADGDGGGIQYHMPMSIQSLIDLDLLEVL